MATHREFDGESDIVVSGTSYLFAQDGSIQIWRDFFHPHRLETAASQADVNSNYAAMPAFAQYDDLINQCALR